ncbi:MAG: nicotinate (nicotinamide) nucleotide adenylyltransferase [Clostridia bacterium]|nr:nicotinate (nicotinamide) nucleotide adenylyltransferase [Clostridia bacterium]
MTVTAFLGGTFDPPHLGHLKLADAAYGLLRPDRFLICPDRVPPHKSAPKLSDAETRFELCRLTFPQDRYIVSDADLGTKEKSYSIDLVKALKERYPDTELWFVMGSDMLLSFDTWYRWQEILRYCSIAAFSREDSVDEEELERFADERIRPYGKVLVGTTEPLEISSTELRERLGTGADVSDYLSPDALKLIRSLGLYGSK